MHFARFARGKGHPRHALPFQISHGENFESGTGLLNPSPEFLSFGSPSSVVGSRPCIGFWFPCPREPTIGSAQFLTHGGQFGGKKTPCRQHWPEAARRPCRSVEPRAQQLTSKHPTDETPVSITALNAKSYQMSHSDTFDKCLAHSMFQNPPPWNEPR